MTEKIKCTVLPGHEVNDGKPHQPGETITLSESEAKRLVKRRIVALVKADTSETEKDGDGRKPDPTKPGGAQTPDPEVEAALKAVTDGNTTRSGMPTTEIMSELLGKPVTAAERDAIWAKSQASQAKG